MSIGPNVRKLWATKIANAAIPAGGGLADGVKFLSDKKALVSGAKAAADWTKNAIAAIRNAGEPNPWKDADDEAIAGEILRRLDARKK